MARKPRVALSPEGSFLFPGSGGSLVTSAGTWTFGTSTNSSGYQILLNGAPAAGGWATKLRVGNLGKLYAENALGNTYLWASGGWTLTSLPSTLSPDGATLLPGSGGSLVTSAGTWTFSEISDSRGNLVLLNGSQADGGSATRLRVDNQGKLYADNAQGDSYEWSGGGWVATALPVTLAPDGSVLLAGSGGSLVTGAGTWTFSESTNAGGNLILLNGAPAGDGAATKLQVANQGQIYAQNAQGDWYGWADGGWSSTTLPSAFSPDGSVLLPGSGGSLVTSAGTWTFSDSTNSSGNLILLDGAAAGNGSAVKLEVANNGRLYADNALGNWYEWAGGGWTATSDPTPDATSTTTSSNTILRAPALLQPTTAGDIVGVRLQNPESTAENSGYVTFGQVFKIGAVKSTDTLVARIDGVDHAVQMDVKATHSDGSVRHAILTLKAPAIDAGGSIDLMLAKGSATAPGTAPTASALLASGYNVSVDFTFYNADGSTATAKISAADTLKSALAAGKVENWLSGSGVNEFDVSTTVNGGKLKLEFHIRAYADGTSTTDVVFDNSWMFSSGKTDLKYDVKISQGGQQVYGATGVPHYLYSKWHRLVSSAGVISPNVQYDIRYLEKTGAIPAYDTSIGVSDASIQANVDGLTAANTGPLGTALVKTYMPNVGGRPDIGTQPAWVVRALMSQDDDANRVMFANADAAGGIPWHLTDESTGDPVSTETYPNFWIDSRGTLVPANGWSSSNPANTWTIDSPHQPDLNYVPYLISGSHYQLSLLQDQANWALASTWPEYGNEYLIDGKYPAGFVLDGMNEERGMAWNLRQVADAAYITPDNDPLKSYYVSALQRNMDALVYQYLEKDINGKYGELEGFIGHKPDYYEVAPWQQGYLVTVLGEIAGMGIPTASAQAVDLLEYMDNFISGLFINGSNGYNPLNGSAYWLAIADPVTGAPYKTWDEFHSANVKLGKLEANPTSLSGYPLDTEGGYPAIASAALATIITYTGSTKAIKAYGYVVGQVANEFAKAGQSEAAAYEKNATWAQMPRLPDGVYLERSQMQIDTSSNDVVLTAKNGDSLLSKVNGGTATLNGGTGTDLLFGGTGKTTFNGGAGDDYIYGGSAQNIFIDNTGDDYYDFAGVGNAISVNIANSGHDTVFSFNSLTDTLTVAPNLNGSGITTASQLIAGATVSNGNTILHLGAQDDITLLGVTSPASLAGSLLVK